jgi:hypothetical protein
VIPFVKFFTQPPSPVCDGGARLFQAICVKAGG